MAEIDPYQIQLLGVRQFNPMLTGPRWPAADTQEKDLDSLPKKKGQCNAGSLQSISQLNLYLGESSL